MKTRRRPLGADGRGLSPAQHAREAQYAFHEAADAWQAASSMARGGRCASAAASLVLGGKAFGRADIHQHEAEVDRDIEMSRKRAVAAQRSGMHDVGSHCLRGVGRTR